MSDRLTVITGDCLVEMRKLQAESVHLIVTSPPYWGLRDYGIPPSIWGGDENCAHEWIEHVQPAANGICHDGGMSGETLSGNSATRRPKRSGFCSKCNAWRGVFGLEPTPELYIEHLTLIMREAKRVLRKDGTLWVNLGDSYATGGGSIGRAPGGGDQGARFLRQGHIETQPNRMKLEGLKSGDLVGIPWRAVFALQADGWWHRRDNIWFKPNPMPESVNGWRWEKHRVKGARESVDFAVRPKGWQAGEGSHDAVADGNYRKNGETDATVATYIDCPGCSKCEPNGGLILRKGNWRCATSHEYVFQFSKSDSYFCNAEVARECVSGGAHKRGAKASMAFKMDAPGKRNRNNPSFQSYMNDLAPNSGRNRRSVWKIATKPYREAHFATFPPDLVRPIVAAASPERCCGECGAPYAPVVERGDPRREQQLACGSDEEGHYFPTGHGKYFEGTRAENARTVKQRILAGMVEKQVTGHRPTCSCGAPASPAAVLDPFGGSGTTGMVALELGRHAILIELNASYVKLIEQRCQVTPGLGV